MEQGDELYSHDSGIGSAMVTHTDSEYKVSYKGTKFFFINPNFLIPAILAI